MTQGLLLAGGTGSRLWPLTSSVNKHFLNVFDKPMVYYPLSILMLSDVRDIHIVCRGEDIEGFQKLLGNGERLGLRLSFLIQDQPLGIGHAIGLLGDSANDENISVVLGDNFFFGRGIQDDLPTAPGIAGVLCFSVEDLSQYGVIEIDSSGKPLRIVEKPMDPVTGLAVAGFYSLPQDASNRLASREASARGEVEITDLLNEYLAEGRLVFAQPGRGSFWQDMGTPIGLQRVAEFVSVWQQRTGRYIACLEEIAVNKGWVDPHLLLREHSLSNGSPYATYVREVAQAAASGTS